MRLEGKALKDLKKELKEREIAFCDHYLVSFSRKSSLIRAGYSANRANQKAWELLQRPRVRKYLEHLKALRADRTGIGQDEVIKEMAKIAFVDMGDFIEYEDGYLRVVDFDEMPYTDVIKTIKIKDNYHPKTGLRVSQTTELQLHDKAKALELMGKHTGAFVERVDVTSNGKAIKGANVTINHRTRGQKLESEEK